jgi:hypothetical protein
LQWKSLLSFFGLQPKHKKDIHEEIFQLIYYHKGGFTFDEVYNLPIYLRKFYLKRLEKQYQDENKQAEKYQQQAQQKYKIRK